MRLYRPVGSEELALVAASGWTAFPPRLPEQPIFYPVLNLSYAEQIARDWNSVRNDDQRGFVLEFEVDDAVAARWPEQTAGQADVHRELWIPAEDLPAFNAAIAGPIEIVAEYHKGERLR